MLLQLPVILFYSKMIPSKPNSLFVGLLHASQQGFKDECVVQEDADIGYHRESDFLFCSASPGGGWRERRREGESKRDWTA